MAQRQDEETVDSMPAIVYKLQQYFIIHKVVEDLVISIQDIGLGNKLEYCEERLKIIELDKIFKLVVLLKDFLKNDEKGRPRERIFNDSGVPLNSFIPKLEEHVRDRNTDECFKTAGDLRALLVVELLARIDRRRESTENYRLLYMIESAN